MKGKTMLYSYEGTIQTGMGAATGKLKETNSRDCTGISGNCRLLLRHD